MKVLKTDINSCEGVYRYGLQGQESDPETGKEAFQLRLWDSRIGRWLTPDPYGQFASPYLGMGNNPISLVDPDGGCVKCDPNAPVGSTATDAGGFGVTMTENGWARNDGYETNLGTFHTVKLEGYLGQARFLMTPNATVGDFQDGYADAVDRIKKSNKILMFGTSMILGMEGGIFASSTPSTSTSRQYNVRINSSVSPKFDINTPNSFRGANSSQVTQHLKNNGWTGVATNPNKMYPGTRFTNGIRGEQIRLMPGNVSRSIHLKQGPHMIISRQGTKTTIPLKGNPSL